MKITLVTSGYTYDAPDSVIVVWFRFAFDGVLSDAHTGLPPEQFEALEAKLEGRRVKRVRTHGVWNYRNPRGGCRCDECRHAHALRYKQERLARTRRLAADPSLAEHGRTSTYRNWGCRCPACTEAHSVACRSYQERRRGART